jgi:transcription elongation factor GreA
MKKLFRLTQEGVDELKAEHAGLVSQRGVVADRIKQARELGDLSENAEYQTAREDQDRLESRISELEHVLQNLEVIKLSKNKTEVHLGSVVELKNGHGKPERFQVVGTLEADPMNGKISDESPIGQALLGKKKDEKVEITLGNKTTTYKVVNIS